MKIYHSDLNTKVMLKYKQLQPNRELRALISFGKRDAHHANLLLKYRNELDGLIMDSGTFTLNSNPKKYRAGINFRGYMSYLRLFADKVDFYFNFDEDFSPGGFEMNFRYQVDLENAGYNPVPVIHDCYGPEIQTYIHRGHKLVAIGSGELARAGLDELRHIVDLLYRNGIRVHFLGCTQYEKLAYLPVYSADSTTWNRTGTSGRIFYWNPQKMGYNKLDKIAMDDKPPKRLTKLHIRNYPFRPQLEEYLGRELDLDINDLLGKKRHFNRALVNLHYFVLLEELINQKHQEQGFTFK